MGQNKTRYRTLVCVCVCVFVEISSVNSHLMDPVRVIVEFGSFVSLDLVTTKEEQAFRGKIGTHLHAQVIKEFYFKQDGESHYRSDDNVLQKVHHVGKFVLAKNTYLMTISGKLV